MASVTELEARASELREQIKDLDAENAGEAFDDATKARWNELNGELETVNETVKELEARTERLRGLSDQPQNVEKEEVYTRNRVVSRVPSDPTQIDEYRKTTNSIDELDQTYRDGARKILERFRTANPEVSREEAQNDIDKLIDIDREVAIRMISTSTPRYRKEFEQYCKHGTVGPEMLRTASLTTTAGGFAVPVELDTTLLLTNAGAINPIRQIARVRQTNVNTVEFINTTGITAAYGAEATEASDNAPVLAQPTVNIEKAFAFVPASIEIFEDWAGIQEDMAMAFGDAKARLESTKFLKGLGHTSQQPQGLIAAGGATAVVSTATTAVFAVADLYSLELALSPRYRARASIVGNRAAFQSVRQFDTAGGANLWVQLQNSNPPTLLGYDAYEWSDYDATPTTSASTILTIGDFNYFAIVDRAGLSVEYIPHLFGSGSRYPTGQRGLYMWWRNSTQVLSPTLQANSAFVSLKVK